MVYTNEQRITYYCRKVYKMQAALKSGEHSLSFSAVGHLQRISATKNHKVKAYWSFEMLTVRELIFRVIWSGLSIWRKKLSSVTNQVCFHLCGDVHKQNCRLGKPSWDSRKTDLLSKWCEFWFAVPYGLVSFKNEAENDVRYRNIIYVLFWHQLEDIDTDSLQFQQNFRRFQSENGWMWIGRPDLVI